MSKDKHSFPFVAARRGGNEVHSLPNLASFQSRTRLGKPAGFRVSREALASVSAAVGIFLSDAARRRVHEPYYNKSGRGERRDPLVS